MHITPESENVEHYILVRVKDTPVDGFQTPMALIRQAIHDATEEHDLAVADIVLRGDRERDILGRYIGLDYDLLSSIFEATFTAFRDHISRTGIKPIRRDEAFKRRIHRNRAERALSVVLGYTEEHGDDLGLRHPVKKKAKHAR